MVRNLLICTLSLTPVGLALADYDNIVEINCSEHFTAKDGHTYGIETEYVHTARSKAPFIYGNRDYTGNRSRAKLQSLDTPNRSIQLIVEGEVSTNATYFQNIWEAEFVSFGTDASILYIFALKRDSAQLVKKIELDEPLIEAPTVFYSGTPRILHLRARTTYGSEFVWNIQTIEKPQLVFEDRPR